MLWTKVTLTLEGLQEKVHCIVVLSKFLIAGKHSHKQHVGMSQQCMEMPENSGQELGKLTFPPRASQTLEYSTLLMQLILKSAPLTQKEKYYHELQ